MFWLPIACVFTLIWIWMTFWFVRSHFCCVRCTHIWRKVQQPNQEVSLRTFSVLFWCDSIRLHQIDYSFPVYSMSENEVRKMKKMYFAHIEWKNRQKKRSKSNLGWIINEMSSKILVDATQLDTLIFYSWAYVHSLNAKHTLAHINSTTRNQIVNRLHTIEMSFLRCFEKVIANEYFHISVTFFYLNKLQK